MRNCSTDKRLPVLLIGFLAYAGSPESQRVLSARPIGVDDGLSQSHVTAIAQDRQGFMWVGTAVGLNRYDGYGFQTYTHRADVTGTLSGDAIFALHVDKKGRVWIGTDQGLDRFDPATTSFERFNVGLPAKSRRRFGLCAIDSDAKGRIWLGMNWDASATAGVAGLDPSTGEIRRIPLALGTDVGVVAIHVRNEKEILFVGLDPSGKLHPGGFVVGLLNPETGQQTIFDLSSDTATVAPVPDDRDISLARAGADSYWIGAPGHRIYHMDLARREIRPHVYDPALASVPASDMVSRVLSGVNGELIVIPTWRRPTRRAGANAIYALAASGGLLRKNSLRPSGACDFTRSFAISGVVDRTGVLWTGISGSGMCVVDLESGMFSHLHESSEGAFLSNNFVRSVWKEKDGTLWVGTRSGVDRIDALRSSTQHLRHHPGQPRSLSSNEVKAVVVDRAGALWVGTQDGGLNRSVDRGKTFEQFRQNPSDSRSIGSNHINAILEDRSGVLWITTLGGGLSRYHPSDRSFTTYRHRPGDPTSIGADETTALLEDHSGRLWVGTEDKGLYWFDRGTGRFFPFQLGHADEPFILSLAENPGQDDIVWVATIRHGLGRCDAGTGRCAWFTAANSLLPSSTVYSVLSDTKGFIWAGTNKGLARIDPRDGSFRIFSTGQGLQSMEFNTRACFSAHDGELLFGGIGGLNAFQPDNITQNEKPPAAVITSVRTLNPRRGESEGLYQVVYKNDGSVPSGRLPAGSREMIFSYAALHYSDPARNRYRVKLEGYDNSWRDMGTLRETTYTNLPPGDYRFVVRAVTSRGIWGQQDAAYSFVIASPIYSKPWFVALVILSVFAAGFLAQRYRVLKLRAAKRSLEAQVEDRTSELSKALATIGDQAEQLREADALKARFITNISHDLRTPLTVTMGTLEDLRSGFHGEIPEQIAGQIDTVMRNERRLLRLVNQMLAIARLDSGKLRLRITHCDLSSLAESLVESFQPAAERKSISLKLIPSGPAVAFCDPEWIGQAISNLVSNALKFTPAGGLVEVEVGTEEETGNVTLTVRDDGPGIRPEDLPRVFDRFFQSEFAESGSSAGLGVGLSLTKEIIELHHGRISAASLTPRGSTFKFELLPGSDHFEPEQMAVSQPPDSGRKEFEAIAGDLFLEEAASTAVADCDSDKPTLLVAEDDRDLHEYLCMHLAGDYRVLPAASGDVAWALIQSETPDLVISDIMMPGMDGYQLCRTMKENPETDFIPIVLLTAKATSVERVEGLECGADDYISKPFEMAEVQARIRNLLRGRERIRSRIAAELSSAPTAAGSLPASADSAFLERVYEAVREHAHDQEFSVEKLAKDLAMSRMHLYRKLQSISGKSPADFLMEYRLDRAAALLAAGTGTVSEIAYGVGFKNLSHFTRRFRDRYGHTPSTHRAKGALVNQAGPL